jgi:hypothetical protein
LKNEEMKDERRRQNEEKRSEKSFFKSVVVVSKKEEKDRNFDTLKTRRSQPREKAADYGEYPHLWSR